MDRACVRAWVGAWGTSRANWVSRSLVLVTPRSVGKGETHYLTPVPGLSPFFLACIPLGPPSTSPLKSKDPKNQEGIQTEGGGARGGNLGESRAHPPSASPGLSRWHTPSPALSHTTPGHGESCGEGDFLGGQGAWHLCLHLPTSVSTKKVRRGGDRRTPRKTGTQKTRDKDSERPRVSRQEDRLTQ